MLHSSVLFDFFQGRFHQPLKSQPHHLMCVFSCRSKLKPSKRSVENKIIGYVQTNEISI